MWDLDPEVVPNFDLLQNPLQAAPESFLSFLFLVKPAFSPSLPSLLLCVFAVVTWKMCVGFLPVCWDDYSRARCAPSEPRLKSWLTGGNSLWMLISPLQSLQFHVVMLAQLECNHVRLTDWGTDRQTSATGWRTWGPERMSRRQMDAGAGQIQGFSCRSGFYWVGLKRVPGKQRGPVVIVPPQRSGSPSHTPLLLGAGG